MSNTPSLSHLTKQILAVPAALWGTFAFQKLASGFKVLRKESAGRSPLKTPGKASCLLPSAKYPTFSTNSPRKGENRRWGRASETTSEGLLPPWGAVEQHHGAEHRGDFT